ncbi:MAG: sulfatase-like hydrolase/transferase, partial [Candidatus Promineifilaceae bacterium]
LLAGRPGLEPDQPAFVFINLMGVHVPYDPPAWARRRFLAADLGRRPARAALQQANRWQVEPGNWLEMALDPAEVRPLLDACYDAETAAQDRHVGHFLECLRDTGRLDRTLVVVTADHGDHLGDQGRINHVFGIHQSLTHVPLLIAGPEVAPSPSLGEPVSTRRIYHTILAAAVAAEPAEAELSLLGGRQEAELFSEAYPLRWGLERLERCRPGLTGRLGHDRPLRAIHVGGRKLTGRPEAYAFYDLAQDPAESRDLAQERPAEAAELASRLERFVAEIRPLAGEARPLPDDPAVLRRLRVLGYVE